MPPARAAVAGGLLVIGSLAALGSLVVGAVDGSSSGEAGDRIVETDAVAARVVLTPTADPTTSQRISWLTEDRSAGQRVTVRDASGGPGWTVAAERRPATTIAHSGTDDPRYAVTLTGLRPGTTYAYRIVSDVGRTPERYFSTAQVGLPESPWSFLAFGDTQAGLRSTVRGVISSAISDEPEARLIVQVGDLVDLPTEDVQWRDAFAAMGETTRTRNWLVSIGNHERCIPVACDSNDAEAFRSYFDRSDVGDPSPCGTWFTTDYQGVRFVMLDATGGRIAEQARFLSDALRTNPNPWAIVVEHAPPYAARPERTNPEVRKLWGPIFEQYGVDLVLSGHDHSYARGQRRAGGPVYVVSVSGPKFYGTTDADWSEHGAELAVAAARTATYQVVTIDGATLHYRAVVAPGGAHASTDRNPGDVLDEFTIRHRADGTHVVRTSS